MRLTKYSHLPENTERETVRELQRLATELNKIWDLAGKLAINSLTKEHRGEICAKTSELQNVLFHHCAEMYRALDLEEHYSPSARKKETSS